MVGLCVAPMCPNRPYPRRNISYFRFPNRSKYPQLHNAWLQAIDRLDFKPIKTSYVCELHFHEDDFDETYKMKKKLMPSEYFRPILKPDAVPKLQLQDCDSSESDNGERMKILSELLGESYLNWKYEYRAPEKVFGTEIKKEKGDQECSKQDCLVKEVKEENETKVCSRTCVLPVKKEVEEKKASGNQHRLFDITTDYILKRPLKPLPEALQRILPSILKVIIKEAPGQTTGTNSKLSRALKHFSCITKLQSDQFHHCKFCNFTTFLQVSLVKHVQNAHPPMEKVGGALRQPMKMYKPKEPNCYWCEECGYKTFSRFLFVKHAYEKKEYHLLEQVEVKWFSCGYCAYKCRKSESLTRHLVNKHSCETINNRN